MFVRMAPTRPSAPPEHRTTNQLEFLETPKTIETKTKTKKKVKEVSKLQDYMSSYFTPEQGKRSRRMTQQSPQPTQNFCFSDSSCGKGRQRALIKKLPLTSRQIFHGRNWVPMTEFGKGEDEAECECEWVMDYTKNKLEDIVDLNSGEKTMMNLWNKHVNRYQVKFIPSKKIFTNFCSRVVEQST